MAVCFPAQALLPLHLHPRWKTSEIREYQSMVDFWRRQQIPSRHGRQSQGRKRRQSKLCSLPVLRATKLHLKDIRFYNQSSNRCIPRVRPVACSKILHTILLGKGKWVLAETSVKGFSR